MSALAGAIVWIGISLITAVREGGTIIEALTGNYEPWDYPIYNWVGVPLLLVTAGFIGFFSPRRAWRWGIMQCVSQWLVMVIENPHGNLMPLNIIAFFPYMLLFAVAATTGARLRTSQNEERPNQAL